MNKSTDNLLFGNDSGDVGSLGSSGANISIGGGGSNTVITGGSSGGIGIGVGYGYGSEQISSFTTTTTTTATTTDTDAQHDSDAGNEDFNTTPDDNNFEMNLRKRKGKIISCAKETIENASRQLRRRLPYAGHLMTPRRLWLNKIPTQCDVVIEFPEDAPDEALRWLLARIRSQQPNGLGLIAHVKNHESTKRTAFYISAPTNILYKAAEEARLPKRLRTDLGGALREFTTRECHCFQQIKNDDGSTTLFTSQERQWLVLQVLQGLRAGPIDLEALQGKAKVEEGQSIVAAWQESGLITQVFPLHETSALTRLQMSWVRKIFAPQPLDDIAEYFGVKVALYFAWLGHYTCALVVPAIFGIIMWAILWGRGQIAQDMGHVLFSLFNVAWASLYLEAWRRYSVELAFRWGTLSTPPDLLEPPRPLYKGPLVESPVTGRLEPKEAPAWKRRAFRYFVSFPIIGLCLLLVFIVMFLMLQFQDWLDHHNIPEKGIFDCMSDVNKDWWDEKLPEGSVFSCLSVIPKVLLAGAITLMDEAYYKLAVWLNDKENYRLQSKYENHLIAKVALFQFVNSFLSLFYIAFYLRDQEKLKEQLAGLLISRQIIGNLRESALPYVVEQWKLAKLSFNMWGALSPTQEAHKTVLDAHQTTKNSTESIDKQYETTASTTTATATKRNIGQAEIESSLYKYDGTFSDHLEMLVQMGYVVLFSAAFPLAGICALLNNLLEIRSDAFKLAHVHQRPFGQRVANIGTWQNALSLLGLAAVIVNCALIGLSGQVSRLWPGLTTTQTIILIVALEHIMLGLRSALTWLLPELPSWLAAEIARAEHCRRQMQCKGPSPRPTPPSPPSTTSVSQQDHEQIDTPDIGTTNDQSIESQLAEDIIYEPGTPFSPHLLHQFDNIHSPFQSSLEGDTNLIDIGDRDQTPDSPPSQTSTILIRPLHESTPPQQNSSGISMQNLPLEIPPYSGACKNCKPTMKIPDIPPFRGYSIKNFSSNAKLHAFSGPLSNTAALSKSMLIQEIPPFRKKSSEEQSSLSSDSPQRTQKLSQTPPPKITEIPPFKPRKSTEWTPQPMNIEPTGLTTTLHGPEWMKRLKVNETSIIHRSIDCIASKELASSSETDILKPAPSWSNVTVINKIEPTTSSSGSSSSTHTQKTIPLLATITTTSPATASATTAAASNDDEAKAAELAAKKSRIKQSLVKRARSVAIFSLKLKERRQREAEKAAHVAIEHAKALAKVPPPGGELSVIPIEKLIQVDDVIKSKTASSSGSGTL